MRVNKLSLINFFQDEQNKFRNVQNEQGSDEQCEWWKKNQMRCP